MTAFLIILLGLLPGFIWLAFYLNEDNRPEPKKLLILTFLSGGAFVVVAVVLEYLVEVGLAKIRISSL
jgi:RsiW-degrading membrane proteinase PrsW (M82 family)